MKTVALVVVAATAAASSPGQLLSASLSAAKTQRSVHYVTTQGTASINIRIVGDAATDRGIQRIAFHKSSHTGHITVVVVSSIAYVNGDAFTLTGFMGIPAPTAAADAGKWMRIPPSSRAFATVAAAVRLHSTIDELMMPGTLTQTPATTIAGQRVIGIRGSITQAGRTSTQTVYVQAAGGHLPVAAVGQSGAAKLHLAFSRWNEPVTVAAPAQTIPFP